MARQSTRTTLADELPARQPETDKSGWILDESIGFRRRPMERHRPCRILRPCPGFAPAERFNLAV